MTVKLRLLVVIVVILAISTLSAQDTITATTRADVSMRIAPDTLTSVMGSIPSDTLIDVIGRDAQPAWVLVSTPQSVTGWIPAGMVIFDDETIPLLDLTVHDDVIQTDNIIEPPETMRDYTDNATLQAHMQTLVDTPVLHNMDTEAVEAIFLDGQTRGNRVDVFTKVGDSDTTSGDYLQPIGLGEQYCTLGTYEYLDETVTHFSTSPMNGVRTSFNNLSVAAVNGLTMVAALDPFWTNSDLCLAGEAPLTCEYRLTQPSVAVMMLGRMDVTYFDVAFYRETAIRVIEESINNGVIPVLTTFVVLPDNDAWEASLEFNATLVDLANTYEIPLINLWRAVQTFPQFGIGPDLTHLRHEIGQFCAFTGAETRLGGTLRNLLTLQALDVLRRRTLVE